jgi:hypothetical protein
VYVVSVVAVVLPLLFFVTLVTVRVLEALGFAGSNVMLALVDLRG